MRKENFDIVKRIGFPDEAIEFLQKAWGQVCVESDFKTQFDGVVALFLDEGKPDFKPQMEELAARVGISPRTAEMLVLIAGLTVAKERFLAAGHNEGLFLETMRDLKNKLLECKRVYGVWGAFTSEWLRNYYFCQRFALGRLQYEVIEFPEEEYKGQIFQGERALCCHIPSSGPLKKEDVLASLKRAYAFYPDAVKEGVLTVVCNSWLLYPKHYPLFKAGSNLQAFHALFDVVREWESNGDFWRIFGYFYEDGKVEDAEENSSLQRAFKAYLLAGNSMGGARGILRFDGENVLTEKK